MKNKITRQNRNYTSRTRRKMKCDNMQINASISNFNGTFWNINSPVNKLY